MKKKFKDTQLGQFINKNFPKVKAVIGDALPDKGIIGLVKNLVSKDMGVDSATKQKALEMIAEYELAEMKEVTTRWKLDMNSDSWLSKNARPLVLLWLVFCVSLFSLLDAVGSSITFSEAWISLFSSLLLTVVVAYFSSRGYEKGKKIGKK